MPLNSRPATGSPVTRHNVYPPLKDIIRAGTGIILTWSDSARQLVIDGGGAASTATWGSISGTLSNQTDLQSALNGKAAVAHTHVIADVTNLQASLDGKQPFDGTLTALAGLNWTIGAMVPVFTGVDTVSLRSVGAGAATDIIDRAAGDGRYSLLGHTHAIADVTGLQTALDGKLSLTGGTLTGGLIGTTARFNGQVSINEAGVAFRLNSTNSNTYKMAIASAGVDQTYIGSDAANLLLIADSGVVQRLALSNAGDLFVAGTINGNGVTLDGAAWTNYTPTVTAVTGTITSFTILAAKFKRIGKTVHVRVSIQITDAGTSGNGNDITLPVAALDTHFSLAGIENSSASSKALAVGPVNTTTVRVRFYDATFAGATNALLVICGSYEAA